MKLFPPTSPRSDELFLVRTVFARRIDLYLPGWESYRLTVDATVRYLRLLGVKDPERAVDLVWGLYAVHVDVGNNEFTVVPKSVVDERIADEHANKAVTAA